VRARINIGEISIPENRQRKNFEEKSLFDLGVSICKVGLLQPIVLREDIETLLAGERRLRTLTRFHEDKDFFDTCAEEAGFVSADARLARDQGQVPYTLAQSLSPSALYEAELCENICRVDLTWQERAAAEAALHKLRVEQHGDYNRGTHEGWSMKDTAAEIAGGAPKTSDQVRVAKSLELSEYLDDPFVAAAPDEKSALKVIRELQQAKARKEAAEAFDISSAPHVFHAVDIYSLESTQFRALCGGAIDVVCTDPPYGVNVDTHKFQGGQHDYDDSRGAWEEMLEKLPLLLQAVCKREAHLYLMCDIRYWQELVPAFAPFGWEFGLRPIIWDKGAAGTYGNHEFEPRHCYDAIAYAWRGGRKVTAMYRDVISIPQIQAAYAAAKPHELYADLLKRSVQPGNRVLDPYCGSGPIFEAAHSLHCTAVGFDKHPRAKDLSILRIKELVG